MHVGPTAFSLSEMDLQC